MRQVDTLAGLTLSLVPGPIRFETHGSVFKVPARVSFELKQPFSTATLPCFPEGPQVRAKVKWTDAFGSEHQAPEVMLKGLTLASVRYKPFSVALLEEGKACEVVLGADELSAYALELDRARGQLKIENARTREDYEKAAAAPERASKESVLLPLSKDPRGGFPLLTARLSQGDEVLTGTFVVGTALALTRVNQDVALGFGLEAGVPIPDDVVLPDEVRAQAKALGGLTYELFELAPGEGRKGGMAALGTWPQQAIAGELGADVWGRYDATFDLAAGVLRLERPRVLISGEHQRCVDGAAANEEACFQLHTAPRPSGGFDVALTVWRSLPRGGRFVLDVTTPGALPCRVGFTLSPQDRGAGLIAELPRTGPGSDGLETCVASLSKATSLKLAAFDETPSTACEGDCSYLSSIDGRRTSCVCAPAPGAGSPEQRALLKKLFEQLHREQQKKLERESEPKDPE